MSYKSLKYHEQYKKFLEGALEDLGYKVNLDNAESVFPVDDTNPSTGACDDIIQSYVNKGQLLVALIIDGICYQDVTKKGDFDERKLVKHLNHLDSDFIGYFSNKYKIDNKELKKCIDNIETIKNKKLYTILNQTLLNLKKDKKIQESLI